MINCMMGRRSLGLCILIFSFAFPTVSYALGQVTLQWHNSTSCEGYYVFGREDGQDYNYTAPWWLGDNSFSACTFDNLEEGKTYYFVIRAFLGDNVSTDSNEVSVTTEKATVTYANPSSGDNLANDSSVNSDPAADNGSANNADAASLSSAETSNNSGGVPHKSSVGCFISYLYNFE
jgi:hypothetical protein